jgi:hypothetical protein
MVWGVLGARGRGRVPVALRAAMVLLLGGGGEDRSTAHGAAAGWGCAGVAPVPGAAACPAEQWSWTRHGGTNCYSDGGHAGDRPSQGNDGWKDWFHGAVDIQGVDDNLRVQNASQCQEACNRLDGCTGVVYGKKGADVKGRCYRRTKFVPQRCEEAGSVWDTYTRAPAGTTWTGHAGLDCSDQAHRKYEGAKDLDEGAYHSQLSVADCQAYCDGFPTCTGVVHYMANDTFANYYGCYLKTDIDISQCFRNPNTVMYTRDRSCEAHCRPGYAAVGNRTVTCTANRSWSAGDLQCRRCSSGSGGGAAGGTAKCVDTAPGHYVGCDAAAQKCVCKWPWYGAQCERQASCSPPCQHKGVCVGQLRAGTFGEREDDYEMRCSCSTQWSGPVCRIPDPCKFKDEARAACKHGGVCTTSTVEEMGFTCECNATGYSGLKCTEGGPNAEADGLPMLAYVGAGVGAVMVVLVLCMSLRHRKQEQIQGRLLRQSLLGGTEMMPAAKLASVDAAARWARAQTTQLQSQGSGSDHMGGSDSSAHYRQVTHTTIACMDDCCC